ncbi:MAG: SOS response-associated peptidase [Cyclobacteriaceae bacterium]|nr:SOS response-associated peptidase [Cyclobacteriaceae bacterium]
MCYEIRSRTLAHLKYARRYEPDLLVIRELEQILESLPSMHYASGFDHPDVPVITNEDGGKARLLNWGLIPNWTQGAMDVVKIQNSTLNARSETIFEKPAFKESILRRRCLVITDGFYEHHHKNGKTFPHHIRLRSGEPMTLAGIWDTWRGMGMERSTFSIVTTRANPLMTRIHNNPKTSEGPRMPVILPQDKEKLWLTLDGSDPKALTDLMVPYDEREMEAYTVPRLKGKEAVGNSAKAYSRHDYAELTTVQGGLF